MPAPRKSARPGGREAAGARRAAGGRGGAEGARGGGSRAGARRRRAAEESSDRDSATREAIAQASRLGDPQEAAREAGRPGGGKGRAADPFTGELRRREVLPLLVLHLMGKGPSYGNQLMDRISAMTEGVLSVNPNTMYPLLRSLESRELIEGNWEHPERRSRRYYALTDRGREEYERLLVEVRPFLDSIAQSIDEIVREVYE